MDKKAVGLGFAQTEEHHHHYAVQLPTPETLPIKAFSQLFMTSEKAVHSRIANNVWKQGVEYCYDSIGHIHVILEGYYAWTKSGKSKRKPSQKASGSETANSGLISAGKVSDISKARNLQQVPKARKPQREFEEKL